MRIDRNETKRRGVLVGKGVMLNATRDTIDELVAALDAGFATIDTN